MGTHISRSTRDANGGNGADHSMADISRNARRLSSELHELGGTVQEIADGCSAVARDQLKRQPYVVIAIAAGIGYVLGGGLPRGVVRRLMMLGGRVMLEGAIANFAATVSGSSSERR